ncbi:hypothetical protein MKW94_014047 [Papaver nudicaule]|uniref:Uncharacterized protein n=1 Tax=Papaver nudicaule TaxID=74823 RepID=A0AA41SCT0_PAPNU|nr:hypothetical protein [Papaver nudicaule]
MMAQSLIPSSQITTALNSRRIPKKSSLLTPAHQQNPLLSPILNPSRSSLFPLLRVNNRKVRKGVYANAVVDGGSEAIANLERCFGAASASTSSSVTPSMSCVTMKGSNYGAFGAVTLEKSKLDMTKPETKTSPEVATGGGDGGNGKKISNGGGDGGDDGGDDDDYFGDFDEGDDGDEGGLFRRRLLLQELYDRKFLDAVLQEWQKTMMDLPAGIRQAYEMGLVSSAQMVKYLAMNARPTTARFVSRTLPQGMSRAFIGRMIADPAFIYKFLLEQAATIGCSVWWEVKTRKERLKQEWDLALINVLTTTACNAVVVWSLAPCRSYGNTFTSDLQNTIQKLPNNVFEGSYPQRTFDLQKRLQSFFYKAAKLCMVGITAGAAQGALSKLSASKKEGRLSVTIPKVSANALGYGAFLGIYANLRYQLLWGLDRAVINHFDVLGVALCLSTAMRVLNVQVGETSKLAWLGMQADPLVESDNLLKAYNRPTEAAPASSSNWFISKNPIVSGLDLLGIKQGNTDQEAPPPPNTRRKRIVRKKVTA